MLDDGHGYPYLEFRMMDYMGRFGALYLCGLTTFDRFISVTWSRIFMSLVLLGVDGFLIQRVKHCKMPFYQQCHDWKGVYSFYRLLF